MSKSKWIYKNLKSTEFNVLAEKFGVHPAIIKILADRGVQGEDAVREYLEADIATVSDGSELTDMQRGVDVIYDAVKAGKYIRIMGDYDVDGVTSTYILYKGLTGLGAKCDKFIPHRITDGYGLHEPAIRDAYDAGVQVILTCDNGIAAANEVKLAKELGMTVVVTDHHEVPYEVRDTCCSDEDVKSEEEQHEVPYTADESGTRHYIIPEADAVIDPKRPEDDGVFKEICGAVVAWKFMWCLYKKFGKEDEFNNSDFLEVASLGTVCDIGDWMTSMLNLNKDSIIVDPTCGSGSFLIQASVKELNACSLNVTENETKNNEKKVRTKNIHGIENEEIAYGLAVTNMLLHGISTDNIKFGSTFDYFEYLVNLGADAYIMNPPYNAKPMTIPEEYKNKWGTSKNAKEDPTKGLVFIQLMSDVVKERNRRLLEKGLKPETAKLVVLVPVSTAIGSSNILKAAKSALLKDNTLDAVFTMPDDMFYPGASVSSCCMVFTLGQPHVNADDSVTKTFLGYFKNDCHTKRKNGGRVEMYDKNGKSMWKETKEKWLSLYKNKEVEPGLSATATLGEEDEWLCEAYMDADVSKLKKNDFLKSINNFLGSKTTYGNVLDVVNLVNTLKDNKEDIELTDTKTWKPFKVKDIFKNIEKGKCANASALADGDDIAYIGAKWKDNGVMKFCDKESNTDIISTGNCIAMIGQGQGSAGYAMYMENDFIGATSLNLGYADWINMFTGLFVSAVLCLEYDKYSFGRSWTGNRLLETVVYLPAIKNREVYIPDFEYMEKYMKNILF